MKDDDFILIKRNIARNVLKRRLVMGLTQERASSEAGLYSRHWQKIEAAEGNVTILTLLRVARALRIAVPDLLVRP